MFQKIRGLIMEDEPGDQAAAPSQAPQPRPAASAGVTIAGPSLNQEMVDRIRKATFSRNTALTALITASDSLVDIIADPAVRLKAAHKTAGGGRSAKDIADAVAIHLNDVDGEQMRFTQALTAKTASEVGTLKSQAATADAQAKAALSEIEQLTQRIASLQQTAAEKATESAQKTGEAAAVEAQLNAAAEDFKIAADAVRAELNAHKATILSTLG